MRTPGWTIVLAACILVVPAGRGTAQGRGPAPARTTLSGVYSAAQAARGRVVYVSYCRSCHSVQSHTGATFAQWWRGKQLSEMYTWIGERMPKNDPGSLAYEEVADVVAYLLQMNAMPVGRRELPPDSAALSKIRIVTATKRTTP